MVGEPQAEDEPTAKEGCEGELVGGLMWGAQAELEVPRYERESEPVLGSHEPSAHGVGAGDICLCQEMIGWVPPRKRKNTKPEHFCYTHSGSPSLVILPTA